MCSRGVLWHHAHRGRRTMLNKTSPRQDFVSQKQKNRLDHVICHPAYNNNLRLSVEKMSTFSKYILTVCNLPKELHCGPFRSCQLLLSRSILDHFQKLLSPLVTFTQKHGKIGFVLEKYGHFSFNIMSL